MLTPEYVDIYGGSLAVLEERLQFLTSLLSEDEIQRANRFHFPEHRRRFVVARGMLRELLGQYLNLDPMQVQFEYSSHGKPRIQGESSLKFNLSHSQDLVLYGFTLEREIGVDLEYLRPLENASQLAQRFFCPREYEVIRTLDLENQKKVFFKAWTAKEAYLKAIGAGISGGLDQVELELSLDEPVKLRSLPSLWSLVSLHLHPDYADAVAIQGADYQLRVCNNTKSA